MSVRHAALPRDMTPEEREEALRKYNEAWGPSWRRMEAALFNLFTEERKPMKTIEQLNADYIRTHAEWAAAGYTTGPSRDAHFEARNQLLDAKHNERRNATPIQTNLAVKPSLLDILKNYSRYHWQQDHEVRSFFEKNRGPGKSDLDEAIAQVLRYQEEIERLQGIVARQQIELEQHRTKAQYANEPFIEAQRRVKTLMDEVAVLRYDNNRLTERLGKMKAQVAAL